MMIAIPRLAFSVTVALLCLTALAARGTEIRIMAGGPLAAVFKEIGPRFEGETGHKLAPRFSGTAVIRKEIDDGEAFDLVVTDARSIDEWIKGGKITSASRVAVANVGLGVGVRAGHPKPDVTSVDASRRALLAAATIGHGSESASATSFRMLLDRLGISEEIKPKLRPMGLGMPYKSVAAGEVEIIVAVVPGIIAAPGIELAGTFPPELQNYVAFAAGISSSAKAPDAARELIRFLATPFAIGVLRSKGLEAVLQP